MISNHDPPHVRELTAKHKTKEDLTCAPCSAKSLAGKHVSAVGGVLGLLTDGGALPDAVAATAAAERWPLTYVEDSNPRRADGALGAASGLAGLADALDQPGARQRLEDSDREAMSRLAP